MHFIPPELFRELQTGLPGHKAWGIKLTSPRGKWPGQSLRRSISPIESGLYAGYLENNCVRQIEYTIRLRRHPEGLLNYERGAYGKN